MPNFRKFSLSGIAIVLGMLGCTSDESPTQPATADEAPAFAVAANSWTTKAPYRGVGLSRMRAGMATNSAGQSIVYIFGGLDEFDQTDFPVQAYNVSTNTWTTKASRVGVFESNGVGKIGNRLYFSGGFQSFEPPNSFTNQVWAYDFIRDRMIRKADLPIFGAQGVSGVIDGKLYVLPGTCSGEGYPNPGYCAKEPTRRFFRYDPNTNTWANRPWAPHFHRRGAAAVLNGKFYVAGGFANSEPVDALDVYDPKTNTWQTLAPLPAAGFEAIGAALNGQFYVIVFTESGMRTYAYNPSSNTWRERASPSLRHDDVVRVALGGTARLLAVGGATEFEDPNDSELYTP